ncbi:MAG: type II toxin-antitoxin system antitoxin SocA domain-containing protein [Actinomycetota bacterium]
MPWPARRPPDLGELIRYVVGKGRMRSAVVTRTKLVKLLYLIDVARAEGGGKPLTGLKWRFLHYGPYAAELGAKLELLEKTEALFSSGFGDAVIYNGARDIPDDEEWPPSVSLTINHVVDRWATEELNLLLDHVYFHTAPMRDAHRGQLLDLSAAAEAGVRPRPAPALQPPETSEQLRAGLDVWRASRAQLARAPRLPAADLPPAPDLSPGVRGRGRVRIDEAL